MQNSNLKTTTQNSKLKKLKKILKKLESVVVAYSGGADSTFLLKAALSILGRDNVLAVTSNSETYPYGEGIQAELLAKKMNATHRIIRTSELNIKNFKKNPPDRCYFCKKELFTKLKRIARQNNFKYVIDASNVSDLSDWRPGSIAAKELKIRSPLAEAGLGKDDIRYFSKGLKLSTWNKPSLACLASRFPYYESITKDKLKRIDSAENFLKKLGFRQTRVRCYNSLARIEVESENIDKLTALREKITKKLKKLGFVYIMLDLEGYRTGSMNEIMIGGIHVSRRRRR